MSDVTKEPCGSHEKLAAHPSASLPEQMLSWGELKAAYRLLGQEEVTFERLSTPHWLTTPKEASTREGVLLFIQDASELDFSTQRSKEKASGLWATASLTLWDSWCIAV
jgi:hypothetical protein